jgi:RNA polymerase primary sigma factor
MPTTLRYSGAAPTEAAVNVDPERTMCRLGNTSTNQQRSAVPVVFIQPLSHTQLELEIQPELDASSATTAATATATSPTKLPTAVLRRRRMQRLAGQHSRVVQTAAEAALLPVLQQARCPPPAAAAAAADRRVVGNSNSSNSSNSSSNKGLNRQQEIQYSFQIRTWRAAVRLRDQQPQQPVSHAAWAAAAGVTVMDLRRVLHEGQQARAAIQQSNTGLVTAVAVRYSNAVNQATSHGGGVGSILTVADLVQEGNLGLLQAAERYEPEKGFRFSTYATWWVRQRISRAVNDSSRTIRLPAHVHTTLQKIYKVRAELQLLTGREPTDEELAAAVDLTVQKLQLLTDSSRNVVSLENPLRSGGSAKGERDRRTLGDTLASDAPTPFEDAEADYLRRDIHTTIDAVLAEKERQVILHRFGLHDGKPRTVQETAERMGISRDRVRLVEARALNKLRHPQRNYRLKEYVGCGSDGSEACTTGEATTPEEQVAQHAPADRLWFF